jgi:hypothetical protein
MKHYTKDWTGIKCGKLTVIGKNKKNYWNCKCDCGNNPIVSSASLSGGTQSCGCVSKIRKNQKSGETDTENECKIKNLYSIVMKCFINRIAESRG